MPTVAPLRAALARASIIRPAMYRAAFITLRSSRPVVTSGTEIPTATTTMPVATIVSASVVPRSLGPWRNME